MEEMYKDLKLQTFYDAEKEGYWLVINNKTPHHFFPNGTLENFVGVDVNEFFDRMDSFDKLVLHNAKENGISAYNIKMALEGTKKIEQEKFEEFKKSNNL